MLIAHRALLLTISALLLAAAGLPKDHLLAQESKSSYVLVRNAKVRFRDRVSLTFLRSGIVSAISVKEGSYVATGERLAALKDEIPSAALAVAQREADSDVEIRIAKNQLESAQLEFEAVAAANRSSAGAYSATEVTRLQLAVKKAMLDVERQEYLHSLAELRHAQAYEELQTYYLNAPFAGQITKVKLNLGEEVSQSESLIELVGTRHVVAEGYVDFHEAQMITPGLSVDVTVRAPPESDSKYQSTYRGVLRFVDTSVQQVRGVVRVIADFQIENDQFKDGLLGEMRIFSSDKTKD